MRRDQFDRIYDSRKRKLKRRREKLRREQEENERIENQKREQKEKEGMKKIEDFLLGNVIELAQDVTDDEDQDEDGDENGNIKDGKSKQKEIKTEPKFLEKFLADALLNNEGSPDESVSTQRIPQNSTRQPQKNANAEALGVKRSLILFRRKRYLKALWRFSLILNYCHNCKCFSTRGEEKKWKILCC